MLQLTLTELVLKGLVVPDVQSRSLMLARDRCSPLDDLVRDMVSVHQRLASLTSSVVRYSELMQHGTCQFSKELNALRSRLQEQQLLLTEWALLLINGYILLILPFLISGATRAYSTAFGVPVPLASVLENPDYLVPAFWGVHLGLARSTGRTIWGEKVLEKYLVASEDDDTLRRVALVGPSAMIGGHLDDLQTLIAGVASDEKQKASSSCGCGC